MDVWKDLCGNNKRLVKAGTRWWSKESSITTIFGHFSMPESALYVVLISVMSKIANSDKFNREPRFKAITLKDSFLKYSFVMTSQLYLRIFERISPLSKYLQTSEMDLVQAYRMVSSTTTYLQEISRDFQKVKEATDSFIVWAEKELEQVDEILESEFPDESLVRRKIKKKLPGEISSDQFIINPIEKYKITVHNIVLDSIINKLNERFTKHGSLYSDLSILDPTNFNDINYTMSKKAFTRLSDLIISFDKTATPENLRHELFDFKEKCSSIKYTVPESYDKNVDDNPDESCYESDPEPIKNQLILQGTSREKCTNSKQFCKNCPVCCYIVISKYNMHTNTYKSLYTAYKFLLILSVTQVACERSFSNLKIIKSRIRKSLSQDHLQAFMLMAIEKKTLQEVRNEEVKDTLAKSSPLMSKLLLY